MSSRLRILHLEDELSDAELVQETLAMAGISCDVIRVQTESEFVSALQQGGFDLILADYKLPSFDGISAFYLAQHQSPNVPFVFVSGTLGEDAAIESLKIGATDYVLKTRLSRLVPSVQRALREANERTELSRSEDALRRSEAYLAIAQSLSHTGSFGWRIASGEMFWSQETYRIFELGALTKPTLESIRQRVHPDDQARLNQIIDHISQICLEPASNQITLQARDFHYEHRLLMPDGRIKHLRVAGRAIRDSCAETEFVGAVTDVTAAKEAERELREREAKIRRLVDANIVGIFIWNFEGRIFEANDAFLRITGYDRDDLNAGCLRWTDLTPAEWLSIDKEKWVPQLRASGSLQPFEKEYLRKDGTRVPVLIGAATLHEDKEEGVAFVLDLTERKQAEQSIALRSFALNKVRESAFLIDEKSCFHYVNEEACQTLGYTREELLGMSVKDIDPYYRMDNWSEDWPKIRSRIFESRHRTKDGREFPVEIHVNYFEYDGIGYNLALVRDISERKQAEEVKLEARVAERTRIARDLHDTLLQSFHGLLLRFQTVSQLLPEHSEAKRKLDSAIEQAAEAITEGRDAVQALRASTTGCGDLSVAITVLGRELATDSTKQRSAEFRVTVEGEARSLDPILRDEIYKIAAEALRNAFRHSDAQQINVEIRYDDEQFRLRVRDNGKGIDPAVLSGQYGDRHYGLRGMRERATLIGGRVTVWSTINVGSEVELRLPAGTTYSTTTAREVPD